MIMCDKRDYKDRKAVTEAYPGAAKIVQVEGGWAVFATLADWQTWKKQK